MDYAYNSLGQPEYAQFATKGKRYICPHCGEQPLILRSGLQKSAAFAHKKIPDRTPMQRTCPEYHDNNDCITNSSEKLYVLNGGIPVYLKSSGNVFYIEAVFPQLTSGSMKYLKDNNIKIKINLNSSTITRNVSDYISVQINDFKSKWINVSLVGNCYLSNTDIKNKWLCGIQGLNELNNTFFKYTATGGIRLPRNSRIYVNTRYYFVCSDDSSLLKYKKTKESYQGNGFELKKVGVIKSNNNWDSKQFLVFEFYANKSTDEVQRFITYRYYNLCAEKSELFPLWPPASIEGNQLIYSSKEVDAYFYQKSGVDEKVGCDSSDYSNGLRTQNTFSTVMKINPQHWVSLYTNFKEKINVSNVIERNIIQWHIASRRENVNTFDFRFDLIDNHNVTIETCQDNYLSESVKPQGNVLYELIVKQGEYVLLRTNATLDKKEYYNSIIILNAFGFGRKIYDFRVKNVSDESFDKLFLEELERHIRNHSYQMIRVDRKIIAFYQSISDKNKYLKKLLAKWIYQKSIPYDVYRIIVKGM